MGRTRDTRRWAAGAMGETPHPPSARLPTSQAWR